jgi:cytochrome c biogenesis protein CcmG, thiol:disulfide interchange protein DsbE
MSDSAHSPDSELRRDLAEAVPGRDGGDDQPSSRLRLVAIAATVIALLAISVPFIFQHDLEAEPAVSDAMAPVASHDAAPAGLVSEEYADGACMADAKPAKLDFNIKDLEGKDVALSSFKGNVIILNFWATWCGPCKAEIPAFVELQNTYGKDGLVVVGYSVDDDAPKARAFMNEYKINYPVLLGLGREDVQDAFGPIWGIPASFIISRDGKVCKKHLGIAPKAVFEKEIKALL